MIWERAAVCFSVDDRWTSMGEMAS